MAMHPVQSAIEEILRVFAAIPEDRRKGWFAYFLEGIEEDFGEDALKDIAGILAERFEAGRW